MRNCLTAFLPFQFIFQDSWWALHSVAETGWGGTSTPLVKCDSENIKPRAVNQGRLLWLFYINFNRHQRLSFNLFPHRQQINISRRECSAVGLTLSPSFPTNPPTFKSSTRTNNLSINHSVPVKERGKVIETHVTRHWLGILLLLAPINVSRLKLWSLRYLSWWRNPLDGAMLVVMMGIPRKCMGRC